MFNFWPPESGFGFRIRIPDLIESGSTDLVESGSTDLTESGSNPDPKHRKNFFFNWVGATAYSITGRKNFHTVPYLVDESIQVVKMNFTNVRLELKI